MTLPSTNNVWIIFFIGGILLSYFSASKMEKYIADNTNKTSEFIPLHSEIKQIINDIKFERIIIENKVKQLENSKLLESKVKNEAIQQLLDEKEKMISSYLVKTNSIQIKSDTLEDSLKFYEERWNEEKNYLKFLFIEGILISLIGFIMLFKHQKIRDKMLVGNYVKTRVTKMNCQSCNMKLSDDIKFDVNSNYCSHCVTNNAFNQDVSLNEFQKFISEQLNKKGYSNKEIQKRINKIQFLDRWKKKFDWR